MEKGQSVAASAWDEGTEAEIEQLRASADLEPKNDESDSASDPLGTHMRQYTAPPGVR